MSAVKTLTSGNFEAETKGRICLLDFWATWCAPCKAFAPVLEEAAAELGEDILVGKINVDEDTDLAVRFGIRAIPAVFILKDGEIVKSFVGVQSKERLLDELKKLV